MSLHTLQTRLNWMGGDANSRIKKQKYRSFCAALQNDYNSRKIQLENGDVWQALINLNNLKSDYDKKYISIDYASMLEPGDTFMTLDDKVHWMVYLPDLVETAYLRSEIIRCRYTLDIDGENHWIYFQGPTETAIAWYLSHGTEYNELNLSGTIYIKNTPKTKDYFSRFKKFKIKGHAWEVQVVDYISVPGIIEIEAREYFDNIAEELPEIIKQPDTILDHNEIIKPQIIGKTMVERGTLVGYSVSDEIYNPSTEWKIIGNENVIIKGLHMEGRICELDIKECAVGSFMIYYGTHALEVKVNQFRPEILGPIEVYPYETYKYTIRGLNGDFVLNSPLARIIDETADNECTVEIISGKKGKFVLEFQEHMSDRCYTLPITIKSL